MRVIRPIAGQFRAVLLLLAVVLSGCEVMPGADGADSRTVIPTAPATNETVSATPNPERDATPVADATLGPTATPTSTPTTTAIATASPTPTATVTPKPTAPPVPVSVHLGPMTHAYQTWNNCSAVSASMVLSYYGIDRSQAQLATVFRPNLDDKHVEPRQLVRFFPEYGLRADLYEGGSIETIKQLIAAGFPVVTPQWLDFKPDAIGHYRVVRGYDDTRGGFLVNDSMTGADVLVSYDDFERLWRAFNYRYLPVYQPGSRPQIEQIIGADSVQRSNLQRTLALFSDLAAQHPDDAYYRFSIGTSFFELGNYPEAVAAYEKAASLGLPSKMLWYQFWPVAAYNEVGNHRRALELATAQIADAGTFGEMRFERGRAYEAMSNREAALAEYRQALIDDANLKNASNAITRLGG